jgi:hypothetical protein
MFLGARLVRAAVVPAVSKAGDERDRNERERSVAAVAHGTSKGGGVWEIDRIGGCGIARTGDPAETNHLPQSTVIRIVAGRHATQQVGWVLHASRAGRPSAWPAESLRLPVTGEVHPPGGGNAAVPPPGQVRLEGAEAEATPRLAGISDSTVV